MNCAEVQLHLHWPDANAEGSRAALERHLDGCDICQERLLSLEGLDRMLEEGPLAAMVPAAQDIPAAELSYAQLQARLQRRQEPSPVAVNQPVVATPPAAPLVVANRPVVETDKGLLSRWWAGLWSWSAGPYAYAIPACLALVALWSWQSPWGSVEPGAVRGVAPAVSEHWVAKGGLPPLVDLLYAAPSSDPRGFATPQLAHTEQGLHPGDFVQIRYTMPERVYAMVVSFNAKGESFAFFPLQGKQSAVLAAGEGSLPRKGAWELDDYIGLERLYVLISLRPFTHKQVREAMSRAGSARRLPLCREWTGPWWCKSLLLRKQKRVP